MKTWVLMYLLIWAVFLEMLIIFFPVLGYSSNLDLHTLVGITVVALAFYSFRTVRKTACPERIKRITKATASLAVLDGVLGVPLYLAGNGAPVIPFHDVVVFVHFVLAITIITQASSAATAFDMWEEKEFAQASVGPST